MKILCCCVYVCICRFFFHILVWFARTWKHNIRHLPYILNVFPCLFHLLIMFFSSFFLSRSPLKRERSLEQVERRSRSPHDSRSPKRHRGSPPPSKGRRRSPTPDDRSPQKRGSPSPRDGRQANGSDYSGSPRGKSKSPIDDADGESPRGRSYRSPAEENGRSRSPSPIHRDNRSPVDDDDNHGSPRGSEST